MPKTSDSAPGFLKRNSGTIFVLGVAALILLTLFCGRIGIVLSDDEISLSAPVFYSARIPWSDISEARLEEDYQSGRRAYGYKGFAVTAGDYYSSVYGEYRLFSHARASIMIDLTTPQGHILFNAATDDETRALYDDILKRVSAQ